MVHHINCCCLAYCLTIIWGLQQPDSACSNALRLPAVLRSRAKGKVPPPCTPPAGGGGGGKKTPPAAGGAHKMPPSAGGVKMPPAAGGARAPQPSSKVSTSSAGARAVPDIVAKLPPAKKGKSPPVRPAPDFPFAPKAPTKAPGTGEIPGLHAHMLFAGCMG